MTAANPWITCPHPNPQAALRLFCFPYAGGGTLSYRPWAEQLPFVEVCPILLPGRERRLAEPALTHFPTLIAALHSAIYSYLDKPFVCFGHSMGGLLAFELIHQLQQQGQTPLHLFVSGCRAPQLPDPEPQMHTLPDAEFLEELRRLNGTPDAVLANQELMTLLLPTLRADFTVTKTYCYSPQPPLSCPITAFGGLQDPTVTYDSLTAWQLQTNAAFSLQMLPGDHFFLNSSQALLIQSITTKLSQIIPIL
jgi:medium-chain acyl-[acyl-carrier-protein] hydrolase